jgi:hypothetical protein
MDISSFPCQHTFTYYKLIFHLPSRPIFHTFNPISLPHVFLPCFPCKIGYLQPRSVLRILCNPKVESTHHMYRKDLLKEWSSGHLTSCGWYLDCPTDNTPKLKCKLGEKFKDAHLDKHTLFYFCFKGGKRSHGAKKLKKTKDWLVRPSGDKQDEEDLEQGSKPIIFTVLDCPSMEVTLEYKCRS